MDVKRDDFSWVNSIKNEEFAWGGFSKFEYENPAYDNFRSNNDNC